MAIINTFIHILTFTILFTSSLSDPTAPAPAPHLGSDDSPPLPTASPPALPPASDLPPPSPPASAPSADRSPTPIPSPATAPETADDNDPSSANVKSEQPNESSSGGMSAGKKAGIAVGVIAALCVVGFGGLLYKKRQQNIRRAEFSSAARREFL